MTPPDVLVDIRHIREGSPCVETAPTGKKNGMASGAAGASWPEEGYRDGLWWQTLTCVASRPPARWSIYPWLAVLCQAVFTALGLSGRFSILTLSQSTVAMQRSHARAYGVDGALASVRQLNCSPDLNHRTGGQQGAGTGSARGQRGWRRSHRAGPHWAD